MRAIIEIRNRELREWIAEHIRDFAHVSGDYYETPAGARRVFVAQAVPGLTDDYGRANCGLTGLGGEHSWEQGLAWVRSSGTIIALRGDVLTAAGRRHSVAEVLPDFREFDPEVRYSTGPDRPQFAIGHWYIPDSGYSVSGKRTIAEVVCLDSEAPDSDPLQPALQSVED